MSSSSYVLGEKLQLKVGQVTSPGTSALKILLRHFLVICFRRSKNGLLALTAKDQQGRCFNQLAWGLGAQPRAEGEGPCEQGPQRRFLESPVLCTQEQDTPK